jgi:hypothetical protein
MHTTCFDKHWSSSGVSKIPDDTAVLPSVSSVFGICPPLRGHVSYGDGGSSDCVVCSSYFYYYYKGTESLLLLPHKGPNVPVSDDERAWNFDGMTSLRSGKAPNSYQWCGQIERRPRYRLSRGTSWHSSVPPGECRDNTLIKPRPLPFKSFSINHLSVIVYCSMLFSLAPDSVVRIHGESNL